MSITRVTEASIQLQTHRRQLEVFSASISSENLTGLTALTFLYVTRRVFGANSNQQTPAHDRRHPCCQQKHQSLGFNYLCLEKKA